MNFNEQRIYVDATARISKDENHLINLTLANGESYSALEARRLFPVTKPDTYITLLDMHGEEKAIIRSLDILDPDSRKVVTDSLNNYYLIPEITRIISASEKYGTLHMSVETNNGPKEFDIRNRRQDIKRISNYYLRLRDSHDNRYIISDYTKLDRKSQSYLFNDL